MDHKPQERTASDEQMQFAFTILATLFLGLVGLGLSILLNAPLRPHLQFNINDIFLGVIATIPLAIFLVWFSRTKIPLFADFRQSQIEFFADSNFKFTRSRIIIMSLAAGFGEEILFRGFLQVWLSQFIPAISAVLIAGIVFGLLHFRTALYAIIASIVGIYLGVLFLFSGNLLTAITTHAVYDLVALEYTRRAIANLPRKT